MAWTVEQAWDHSALTGTTVNKSFGVDVTAGSLLLLAMPHGNSDPDPTTDQGDTVVEIASVLSGTQRLTFHYVDSAVGGTTQVTWSGLGGGEVQVAIKEASGHSSGVVASNSADGFGTAISSGTISYVSGTEHWEGIAGWGNGARTPTADSDWDTPAINASKVLISERTVTGTLTDDYAPSLSGNSVWVAAVASFLEDAGGAAGPPAGSLALLGVGA